jgi:nucleotide-binding universal stress UspA family protein
VKDFEIRRWAHPAVILVATDLSDMERLIEISSEQARETGARLLLFHVVSTETAFPAEAMGYPFYDLSGAVQRAHTALNSWCAQARVAGIRCDVLVREGHPAAQIAEAVCQFKVDRILLGTRGRGRFSKLLLGSVADQVLRSVHIPVMTVGPEAHLGVERDTQYRVILLATTLRETSRASAALACQIASSQAVRLVLLHVLPGTKIYEPAGVHYTSEANALRQLYLLASTLCEQTGSRVQGVDTRVTYGNPCDRILDAATRVHASLIVLGASDHSAIHNLTHDRTVYQVPAHASCPVLTLLESDTVAEAGLRTELLQAC